MKNKLTDLNDHLFAEIERLGEEELTGDALIEEITRAKAISNIATNIVNNATVVLRAAEVAADAMNANYKVPALIGVETEQPATINGQKLKSLPDSAFKKAGGEK